MCKEVKISSMEAVVRKTGLWEEAGLWEEVVNGLKSVGRRVRRRIGWTFGKRVYGEPNAETIEAILEARRGESAGIADPSSVEALLASME